MEAPVVSDTPDRSKLIVSFYEEAVLDEKATNGWTEEQYDYNTQNVKMIRHPGAGRPIYKDVTFIEIRIPGNLREIRRREVREIDKRDFPREWAAYQATKQNPVIGTPIEKLPFLTKAQALEVRGMGFQTAEQIRDTSDNDGQKFMGFLDLRRKVSDYLAAVEGHSPIARLENENKQMEQELAALRSQMAEVMRSHEKKGKGA